MLVCCFLCPNVSSPLSLLPLTLIVALFRKLYPSYFSHHAIFRLRFRYCLHSTLWSRSLCVLSFCTAATLRSLYHTKCPMDQCEWNLCDIFVNMNEIKVKMSFIICVCWAMGILSSWCIYVCVIFDLIWSMNASYTRLDIPFDFIVSAALKVDSK